MAVNTVQAIINGTTYNLAYDSSSGKYTATISAPTTSSYNNNTGHYYPVTIKATDQAGNVTTMDDTDGTLGAALKLKVKEKVAPIISITSPTTGATLVNNKPTFTWTVTDADSGVASSTITIKIDSAAAVSSGITKTASGNGYTCSYTPTTALSDGAHTVVFNASDNDGNAATAKSISIKVDTVPPTLNISSPADGLVTNAATVTVSGTTNDVTSSPVTVKVNGQAVTVNSNGSFSTSVTLASGSNTITIVATDSAGKSTTITRTVVQDTVAPTISAVTITPNPVDAGATYIISVTVTD